MSKTKTRELTNCLRGIRNAWHFHYALALVLRCSPLNRAL
ncbi:DUF3265 domain-containing protein [Vibrio parahaemolyticus]|nr:DUF3265 domain-containing protein [Vibrio parahaemolyticus]EGQ9104662.1 DUF3265 domain-containing protein [Vibrio parahaemolyticus]EGQ9623194.1 DUF3265 domain-containing protein [Vibrio parahaemolyticus]EGR2350963.1 DUF3265 domain-containing protein [Vibrio parahaemolyticus]EGR2982560.1 DUF3265 domain-containing protein [Vibrio parahaemolyticus]